MLSLVETEIFIVVDLPCSAFQVIVKTKLVTGGNRCIFR